ncbi:phage integrase [Yersinia nurmii]|uniref:Phage integrase n=1 Tax=Yersinia nurmii TaxID=685706 RepID=A0ABM9SKT5_9GAMM|nr:site-specific integrase [Yersinia nurmii]CNE97112.1 phage integrase [Yersinia nurmii]
MKMRVLQIGYIHQEFGDKPIEAVTTEHIADFINTSVESGKSAMAVNLRSVLSDVFREAIADGLISTNPVEATCTPSPKIKRERLDYAAFCKIYETTDQHRDDVQQLDRSDAHDGKLWTIQSKTKLQIAVSLWLEIMDTSVRETIEKCLMESKSKFLISSASKTDRTGAWRIKCRFTHQSIC